MVYLKEPEELSDVVTGVFDGGWFCQPPLFVSIASALGFRKCLDSRQEIGKTVEQRSVIGTDPSGDGTGFHGADQTV